MRRTCEWKLGISKDGGDYVIVIDSDERDPYRGSTSQLRLRSNQADRMCASMTQLGSTHSLFVGSTVSGCELVLLEVESGALRSTDILRLREMADIDVYVAVLDRSIE